MKNTTNYLLNKPDFTDFADIKKINDNFDTIDTKIKEVDEKAGNIDLSSLQTQIDKKSEIDHKHAISDVTNLQYSLDSRSLVTHKHPISHVTDLQTTLDSKLSTNANAVSATRLATTRTIDGINFDGTSDIKHYAICVSGVTTTIKTVDLPTFNLVAGARISIKFFNRNSVSNPTLNISSKGAKPMLKQNGAPFDNWSANGVYTFIYDGTSFIVQGESGLEDEKVTTEQLNAHLGDNVSHITATERTNWNNKSNFSGNYNDLTNKPTLDANHKHAISDVTNLQYSLDSRSLVTHKHTISHVTDLQTTLDSKLGTNANAVSATKLVTTRTIDGMNFDGTANIVNYTTCVIGAATTAKTATLSTFNLVTGARISIKFYYDNSATAPTLNINSTGAKGLRKSDGSAFNNWSANGVYTFVYDGSAFILQGGYAESLLLFSDKTFTTSTLPVGKLGLIY